MTSAAIEPTPEKIPESPLSTGAAVGEAGPPTSRQASLIGGLALPDGGASPSPLLFDTELRAGESMGSWLYRLAQLNGFRTIREFMLSHRIVGTVNYFSDHPVDVSATIRRLVLECGAEMHTARAMLLTDDIAALSNSPGQKRSTWVNAKGMPHAICPECISEGGEDPSWQRVWRLSTTTHCAQHERLLLDRCPRCQHHFGITKSRTALLDRCECCNTAISAFMGRNVADPSPTRFGGTTDRGLVEQFPVGPVGQQAWWLGVNRLLHLISTPHFAAALLELDLPDQFSIGLLHLSKNKRVPFPLYDPAQRARMIGLTEWLLSPWPDRFLSVVGRAVPNWPRVLLYELSPAWLVDFCLANTLSKTPSQRELRFRSRPCMIEGSKEPVRGARFSAWPHTEEAVEGRPSPNIREPNPLQLQLGL